MSSIRSRFVDFAPSGTSLVIGDRDIAIFQLLHEFPYLPLPYIGELLGHPKRTSIQAGREVTRYPYLRQRLSRLRKDGGYLHCPAQSWQAANARYRPAVYALTPKAKVLLATRGLFQSALKSGNDFAHDLGACLVAASFRIGINLRSSLRLVRHPEILAHPACPETTRKSSEPFLIPVRFQYTPRTGGSLLVDGHKEHDWPPFGIARALDGGRERKIFFPGLEFDRWTEPLESDGRTRASIARHLSGILALLESGYRRHLGIPSAYVLFVTVGEARRSSVERLLLKLTGGKGSDRILFKCVADFASHGPFPPATDHMLATPWKRAGHPDFNILDALG